MSKPSIGAVSIWNAIDKARADLIEEVSPQLLDLPDAVHPSEEHRAGMQCFPFRCRKLHHIQSHTRKRNPIGLKHLLVPSSLTPFLLPSLAENFFLKLCPALSSSKDSCPFPSADGKTNQTVSETLLTSCISSDKTWGTSCTTDRNAFLSHTGLPASC